MKPRSTPQIPHWQRGDTWIEGEDWNDDVGQFRRRGLVRHLRTGRLIAVRLATPDTYFSIPATSETEHGYVTSNEEEFEFRPHPDQGGMSPADYRKRVRQESR